MNVGLERRRDYSWAPPPIFDGWRADADNLSARRRGHAGLFELLCYIFHALWDIALNCYYCRSYSECNHNNTNNTCDDSRSNICLACPPCSMKIESHRRGKNIWFYKQGISGRDEMAGNGWQLYTLETFIKTFNETDVGAKTTFPLYS